MSTFPNLTANQIRAFFDAHWTVRKYKPHVMPPEHLEVLLHAAQRAPTDATAQMYSLIRLTEPTLREQIAKLAHNPHMATASECFIVCGDVHRLKALMQHRDFSPASLPHISVHFAIGDAVMAGQNLMIAAEMMGYRACWIGGVLGALNEISDLMALPQDVFPFAGLTIGLPDEAPQHRPRVARTMVIHENRYQSPTPEQLDVAIQQMAPITARGDWGQSLARYFGKGGYMEAREADLQAFLVKKLGMFSGNSK